MKRSRMIFFSVLFVFIATLSANAQKPEINFEVSLDSTQNQDSKTIQVSLTDNSNTAAIEYMLYKKENNSFIELYSSEEIQKTSFQFADVKEGTYLVIVKIGEQKDVEQIIVK